MINTLYLNTFLVSSHMNTYMRHTYNAIANSFDKTRYAQWPCVVRFYEQGAHGYCIDIGCGNGKNVFHGNGAWYELCDMSDAFIEISSAKHPASGMCQVDAVKLPYRSNVFDTAISIAVIHHLDTISKRQAFVDEFVRVLKPGGRGLITAWARVDTKPQDRNVPWTNTSNNTVTQRYYHMFDAGELESLVRNTGCTFTSEYERDNHVVTLLKRSKVRNNSRVTL